MLAVEMKRMNTNKRRLGMRIYLLLLVCSFICIDGMQTASAESAASGFLVVNGIKIKLVHAYIDEGDPHEPIVILSDKPLPAEAIPFLPEKLVKEKKVHAIAFSISRKDQKLTNTYGKVYYPGQELGVGMGRVEDGKVTLTIKRLDAAMIQGNIATPKPVKFSDVSYSFDVSFEAGFGKTSDKPSGKSALPEISVAGNDSPPARAYAEYHRGCIEGDIKMIRGFLAAKNLKEFDTSGKEMREAMIDTLKMRPSKIKIGKPTVTSDKASFTVEGTGGDIEKAIGSIKMILENGSWKVLKDKWEITSK
jgi:hypothetical protein